MTELASLSLNNGDSVPKLCTGIVPYSKRHAQQLYRLIEYAIDLVQRSMGRLDKEEDDENITCPHQK